MIRIIALKDFKELKFLEIIETMFYDYPWIIQSYKSLKQKFIDFWMENKDFEEIHEDFKISLLTINEDVINNNFSLESEKIFIESLEQQNNKTFEIIKNIEQKIYNRELEQMERKHENKNIWNVFNNFTF